MKSKFKISNMIIIIVVGAFSVFCLLPFWLVISGSFLPENEILHHGYELIPAHIDLTAYRVLFMDREPVLNGYKISAIVTIVGTALSVTITSMMAYPISQKRFKLRRAVMFFTMITLLFNGGMVPWFILCRNVLHLHDSYAALIVPYLVNAWNVFLVRNYFQTIPQELTESAKIDGANEFVILWRIILPVSTPILATITLFISLGYWNDWWLGLMLVDKQSFQPLQLLLRTIQNNVDFLQTSPNAGQVSSMIRNLPSQGLRMATCVVTVGPIILVYPFIQKYFVKGLMIGAVKG